MQPLPKIDYFMGYPVTKVGSVRQAGEDQGWFIQFSNGGKISNLDRRFNAPTDIVGLKLSAHEEVDTSITLHFGDDLVPDKIQVTLNSNKYGVAHPRLHGGSMIGPTNPPPTEAEIVHDEDDPRVVVAPQDGADDQGEG